MISFEAYQQLALSFPGTSEEPHFDKVSFRVKKKIFATYHPQENKAMLKLSLIDQSVFCAYEGKAFYPVPGAWGAGGATFVDLKRIRKGMFKDALKCAYNELTKKKTN